MSYRSEDPPQTATYNLVPSADGTVVTARHSPWQIPGTEFFQVGLDAFYLRYLNDVMLSMKRHIESQPPSTVPTVFLSYRRSAAGYVAGRLVESLTQEFGPNSVFQDRLSIDAGQDAQERVELEIERCVASIVLIHPGWIDELEARERDGVRDWVREEVQRALGLGKPVMPVFLSDVKEDEIRGRLPSDLSKLNDFQWQRLGRDPEFPGDIDRIVRSVWASVRLEEPRFETARGKPVPDWDGGGLTGLSDVLARVSSFYGAAFGSIFDRIAMGGPGSEVPGDRAER